MRLSCRFAAIAAASFHAGGIALPTAQDFNTTRLEETARAIVTPFSHAKKVGNDVLARRALGTKHTKKNVGSDRGSRNSFASVVTTLPRL